MGRLLDEDDVVDWLLKRTEMYDETGHFVDENVVKKNIESQIAKIPSAQSVHNTGKWVRGTGHGLGVYNWTCKCGHVIVATVPDRFCGACGCDNAEGRTDE